MKYLIVAAHPDDEVLGFGSAAFELSQKGHHVEACVLSSESSTRGDNLEKKMLETHKMLGIKRLFLGHFRCMCFKDEPHWDMVRFIEDAIRSCEPDVVITHHPADLHNDHYITSIVCQEAVRLPQRQIGYKKPVSEFLFMMINSSTDWSLNQSWGRFNPNTFIDITEEAVEKKIDALRIYDNVVRPAPYPRSEETIHSQAVLFGSMSGTEYAEGFECVFRRCIV